MTPSPSETEVSADAYLFDTFVVRQSACVEQNLQIGTITSKIDQLNATFEEQAKISSAHLETLTKTTNSIPDGAYQLELMSGVIGALIAALAAMLVNHGYRYFMKKSDILRQFVRNILTCIDELESHTIATGVRIRHQITNSR